MYNYKISNAERKPSTSFLSYAVTIFNAPEV